MLLPLLLARGAAAVDDPFAHWTFDAGTGADVSGNALDVTPHGGIQFVPGHVGQVAKLDGATGNLDHSALAAFTPGSDSWTVLGWVLALPDSSGWHTIVSWYRCGANPGCTIPDAAAYQLLLTDHGRAELWMRDDQTREFLLTGNTNVADGRWHMLAGTLDAAAGHAVLYVDGAAVKDSVAAFGPLTPGSILIPFTIGDTFRTGWASPASFFHGSLDDVRLYRRALSAAEVLTQFQAGVVAVAGRAPSPGIELGTARPNPSTAASSVRIRLAAPGAVRLGVFDVLGRRIRRLFEGAKDAGEFAAAWDGLDDAGRTAPAGVYFYRLEVRSAGAPATARATPVTLVR
jgi:hypothetical protein